jgi:tRNA1Val (adenine37-N6)-methyltransferase
MGSKSFQFKQFNVAQNQCTHKVGTDGVLLGAWVNVNSSPKSILDVGTGTGLISMMLAQRTDAEARIDAIEIQAEDANQARENVQRSPWPHKIHVHNIALQDFLPETTYDLVISNPPYFVNSWLPPEPKRSYARHSESLSFDDLLVHGHRLLSPNGRLAVITPYEEGLNFINLARSLKLFPVRRTAFRSRPQKPVERLLLEFSAAGQPEAETQIVLYGEGDAWTDEYKCLTREFYLHI